MNWNENSNLMKENNNNKLCLFLAVVVFVVGAGYMDIFALEFHPNLRSSLGSFFFCPKSKKNGRVVPSGSRLSMKLLRKNEKKT